MIENYLRSLQKDRAFSYSLLILVCWSLIRNGGLGVKIPWALFEWSSRFPDDPPGYLSTSLLSPLVSHWIGISSPSAWLILHAMVLMLSLVILWRFLAINVPCVNTRVMLAVLWTSSGLYVSQISMVGFYDVWIFLGATLALCRRLLWVSVAGLLFGLTNPLVGLLGFLSAGLVVMSLDAARRRHLYLSRALAFSIGLAIAQIVQQVFKSPMQEETRVSEFSENFQAGINGFLQIPQFHIWSFYGGGWLLIGSLLMACPPKARALLAAGLIGLPALATILTVDGTRVFGAVSALPLACFSISYTQREGLKNWSSREPSRVLIPAILLPTICTWANGTIVFPLESLVEFAREHALS